MSADSIERLLIAVSKIKDHEGRQLEIDPVDVLTPSVLEQLPRFALTLMEKKAPK